MIVLVYDLDSFEKVIKMKGLRRVLVYEIGRFCPDSLLALEVVCKRLKSTVASDPAYIQTLIEDIFGDFATRNLSFRECKNVLNSLKNQMQYVFITQNKKLVRYNIARKSKQFYDIW